MRRNPRLILIGAVAALALAVTPVAALAADDDGGGGHGGGDLLRSGLVGSTPLPAGATIFGVNPGGAPWVVDEGKVRVRRDGRLDLRVEGLIIPGRGTGAVLTVTATLFCNATSAAVTSPVPLSTDGDAMIRAELMLPATCVAPVVLLNPNGGAGAYIAATG